MSGQYRGGDTRVLIVDPGHLMATSYGPGPMLVPPPTPDSRQQGRARRPRLLDRPQEVPHLRTPVQVRNWRQYKITLERAIRAGSGPVSASSIVMHTAILDMLVLTFKGEDDILDER